MRCKERRTKDDTRKAEEKFHSYVTNVLNAPCAMSVMITLHMVFLTCVARLSVVFAVHSRSLTTRFWIPSIRANIVSGVAFTDDLGTRKKLRRQCDGYVSFGDRG